MNIVNESERFSQPDAAASYIAGLKYEADKKAALMADQARLNADLTAQQRNWTYTSQKVLLAGKRNPACNTP